MAATLIMIVVYVNCTSVKLSTKFLTIFSLGKILSLSVIIIAGLVMVGKG